jgi:hypothetical protein
MITETRESRTRLLHYEQHHRRPRRRYHTLDNGTLDKFNFICIPLHRDEVNLLISFSSGFVLIFFSSILGNVTNCCFLTLRKFFLSQLNLRLQKKRNGQFLSSLNHDSLEMLINDFFFFLYK